MRIELKIAKDEDPRTIGSRIRAIRVGKGLSLSALAAALDVDRSAVAKWEAGKHLPRDERRRSLAAALDVSVATLFGNDHNAPSLHAMLVDTLTDLEPILFARLKAARNTIKALRIAAPYPTPAHVQKEFRRYIGERILADTIEVQRVEVVYSLDRLKELLSNIFRYDGHRYWVKVHCVGLTEVLPGFGGYYFDDEYFLLGAYWTGVPPHGKPGLEIAGEPVRAFFKEYWSEIWRRGTLLNNRGAHDLSAVREVALALGLESTKWGKFVKEAQSLEIGDGAPPFI